MFSTESIQFKLDKLDPIKGVKTYFLNKSNRGIIKIILKISFVGFVTFYVFCKRMDEIHGAYSKIGWDALMLLVDINH